MKKSIHIWAIALCFITQVHASSVPTRATSGMVVSQSELCSQVGVKVLQDGGNAIDAAVATAFALAVAHPAAGNIGGGGFLLYHPTDGPPVAIEFRETAPASATPDMFMEAGKYSPDLHHEGHKSVGVPGTVAGLHLAWKKYGKLSWPRVVEPAIRLAERGFPVSHGLAESLDESLPRLRKYPASAAQFTSKGEPLKPGQLLIQKELAATLQRIAELGPPGFYEGRTAELIQAEMTRNGGLISQSDLKNYTAKMREPVTGSYRGYDIISFPPPSSGGIAVIECLNILEAYPIRATGFGSARNTHLYVEAMRKVFLDRAKFLGDPDFNSGIPIQRLTSKEYAAQLRVGIRQNTASRSDPAQISQREESGETTHFSVVDARRNAVSLTYTLEHSYGSGIVVPGAGFLLNNEMGDFNPVAGLTTRRGLIGTTPNLVAPGKRMLSSMTPTIVAKDGKVFLVTGSPGGRTIINTVAQTIINVIDHEMNAQQAVDAPRIHHQWLPDVIRYEKNGISPDTLVALQKLGHRLTPIDRLGSAQIILVDPKSDVLQGGSDRRRPDAGAAGY